MTVLRITEIFHSLQGETSLAGLPTIFIRLTGCPLRCHYCDTAYAFAGGALMKVEDILLQVEAMGTRYVTVTGGEPLAQPGVHELLAKLCDKGYTVSLETAGALSVEAVDPRVIKILDLKTPGSGEVSRNDYGNIPYLLNHDQVKFVICDKGDYQWARLKVEELDLARRVSDVLFSPAFGQQDPAELASWILQDKLPVRMQLQLHKILWGDKPGV